MKPFIPGLIISAMAAASFAAAPELPPEAQTLAAEYMQQPENKIFVIAVDEDGRFAHGSAFGKGSMKDAALISLKQCDNERDEKGIAMPPVIYAINNKVVYEEMYEKALPGIKDAAAKERARREARARAQLDATEKKAALIQADDETLPSTVRLDAFMKAWSKYESFKGPWDPKDEPLLLAALEKDPKGPWAAYISMKFSTTKFEARKLDAAGRTAHYKAALGYLQPACDILAKAVEASPEDKELQQSLTMMEGLVLQVALETGVKLATVKAHAEAALANNTDKKSWNYGNMIYKHHTSLGRVALREGKLDEAKKHLHAAGNTPGSPQLNSYGPDFILARELAEQGEYEAVIAFLDQVARFWGNPDARTQANSKRIATDHLKELESWKKELREGNVPDHRKWK